MLHLNANHRLAIAKILNISIIPVLVQGVHEEWVYKAIKKHKIDILSSINMELCTQSDRSLTGKY